MVCAHGPAELWLTAFHARLGHVCVFVICQDNLFRIAQASCAMLGVSQISLRIEKAISKTASMATEELALLENCTEKIN